jgi:hypothetical protein
MVVRLSALRFGRPFTIQEDSWDSFLLDAESSEDHIAAGRIRSVEKFHLIGKSIVYIEMKQRILMESQVMA